MPFPSHAAFQFLSALAPTFPSIVDTIVVAWTHVPLKIHVPCHILPLFQNKSCGFPSTCFRPGAHPSLWMKVMPPTSETFIHSHRSAPSNASSASFLAFFHLLLRFGKAQLCRFVEPFLLHLTLTCWYAHSITFALTSILLRFSDAFC
jgi:hypothetical protein